MQKQLCVERKREVLSLIPCEFLVIEGAAHGDDLFYQDEVSDSVLQFLNSISEGKK